MGSEYAYGANDYVGNDYGGKDYGGSDYGGHGDYDGNHYGGDYEECLSEPGAMCNFIQQIDCPGGPLNVTDTAHQSCVCLMKQAFSSVLVNNNTVFETFTEYDYYDEDQFSDIRCDTHHNTTETFYSGFEQQKTYFVVFVFMCLLGIVNNSLSIIVLTKPHMRNPINFLLTALATMDLLSLSFRLVYYIDVFVNDGHTCAPFASAVIDVIDIGVFYTFHVSGIWLTVSLAAVRYMFVCRSQSASFSQLRARVLVAGVFVAVLITRIPAFFFYTVGEFEMFETRGNSTVGKVCYEKVKSEWARDNPSYDTVRLYYFAVVNKIIPPILLTIFFARIIYTLQTTRQRRESQLGRKSKEHNRYTR